MHIPYSYGRKEFLYSLSKHIPDRSWRPRQRTPTTFTTASWQSQHFRHSVISDEVEEHEPTKTIAQEGQERWVPRPQHNLR
eukprot:737528-Pleurochrysis_carterae.AAC.1